MGTIIDKLRLVKYLFEKVYYLTYSRFHKMEKKVLFQSFDGKQYSDNPRAISEKLHELFPDYKIVWKLDNKNDKYGIIPDYVSFIPDEKIKAFPFKYLGELSRSCCMVTNDAIVASSPKRKGQFFISTWHGDRAFKKVLAALPEHKGIPLEDKYADICVAGSKYGENQFRTAFLFTGEIFTHGTPRDDILVNNSSNDRKIVLEKLRLSPLFKYLLYAPTYKDNSNKTAQFNEALSLSRTLSSLQKATGYEWKALSRAHSAAYGGIKYNDEDSDLIIDVSDYPDMSDILLIADMLITDYSSSPGDAALRNIPIILFQNEEYSRPLYFKMEESPFFVAKTQKELEDLIVSLTEERIRENCKQILEFYGTYESGQASELIAKRINEEYMKLGQ